MKKTLLVILLTLFTFALKADYYVDVCEDTIETKIQLDVPDTSLLKHFYGKDTLLIKSNQFFKGDTIYVKHEDKTCKEPTIWDKMGRLIEAILSLLVGGGVAWITSCINTRAESKRMRFTFNQARKNEMLQTEENVYSKLRQLQHIAKQEKSEEADAQINDVDSFLNANRLHMRKSTYLAAYDIFTYLCYSYDNPDDFDSNELDALFETYIQKEQKSIEE